MADDNVTSDNKNVASENDVKLIAGYPGPALLLNADAKPILANAKGVGLEKALVGGVVPEIEALIEKSSESTSIANATVTIATSRGELVLEVTAIPVLDVEKAVTKTLVLARDLTMERNLLTTSLNRDSGIKTLLRYPVTFHGKWIRRANSFLSRFKLPWAISPMNSF